MKLNEDSLILFTFLVISFNDHQLIILKLFWLPDWEKRKLKITYSYSQIETRFESCERSRFPARKCALPVHEVVQLIVFKINYEVLKFDIILFAKIYIKI